MRTLPPYAIIDYKCNFGLAEITEAAPAREPSPSTGHTHTMYANSDKNIQHVFSGSHITKNPHIQKTNREI